MKKLAEIDPLNIVRDIACLMVFMHHVTIFEDCSFFGNGLTFLLRGQGWGGVWIFFCLGGYLIGRGYASGRYSLSVNGIWKFYLKRFTKAVIPSIAFILLIIFFQQPDYFINNPGTVKNWLTLHYAGPDAAGALWYVFCIMWLWIFSPLVASACKLIEKCKYSRILFAITYVALVIFGYKYRNWIFVSGREWYDGAYDNPIANIDLYFGGFVFAYLLNGLDSKHTNKGKNRNIVLAVSVLIFVLAVIVNFYAFDSSALRDVNYYWLIICQYRYATVYLLVCSLVFWASYSESVRYSKGNGFSSITFEFYLFHSLVLTQIQYIIPFENGTLKHHFALTAVAFIITLALSIGYKGAIKAFRLNALKKKGENHA